MPNEPISSHVYTGHSEETWDSAERLGSLIGGGAILALSWPWRSPARIGAMIGGGILLYWGVTGDERLCRLIGYERSHTRSGIASVHHNRSIRIEKAVAVSGPVENIYRIWRNPENIPRFADQLKSVRAISDLRSHWIVKGPAGKELQWESEIYNEKQNESFAWRSLLNADVNNAGSVHFRSLPDSRTEIRVVMSYEPPGGILGSLAAKLSGDDPEVQLQEGLNHFKQAFETGQLVVH